MSTFSKLLGAIEDPHHIMKIRALEKLNKKKIDAKFGVFLNEVCLSERLVPNYTNMYIYIYIYIFIYYFCGVELENEKAKQS